MSSSYIKPSRTRQSKKLSNTQKTYVKEEHVVEASKAKKPQDVPPMSQPAKQSSRKRKSRGDDSELEDGQKSKSTRKKKKDEPAEEKRLKTFRAKPLSTYLERLSRVRAQRMFLINRNRTTSADGAHEEETTGNVYQVTITKVPLCSCPDVLKGNQCKHIIYVLVNVLKVREDLAYQLVFLTDELTDIFANAPQTPQSGDATSEAPDTTDTGGRRKPIEGDCPVCVMEFEESDKEEDVIWCKAACGNNIHRHCFEQWAKSKPGAPKCVYCRTVWKGDEHSLKLIAREAGKVGDEGYINVAGELGFGCQRDMSSYHQHWVNRQSDGRSYRGYDYDYDEY